MLWLTQQGHNVIGVELSPLAVRAFFAENGLHPHKRRAGKFTLWQSGRISILCGDYFALRAADIGIIDAVYDRAALTALPLDIRQLYITHLAEIVKPSSRIFLLTIEDAEAGDTLEQALAIDREIAALYAATHNIELAHIETAVDLDPQPDSEGSLQRANYKVYRLSALDISTQ